MTRHGTSVRMSSRPVRLGLSAVFFSQNKSAASNQPTILFSHNKSAPAISHLSNEQAVSFYVAISLTVYSF
jgi:hypothetical protein